MVLKDPLTTVISSLLENPLTASEKISVTVAVSPAFNDVSLIVKEETVGYLVSISKFDVVADGPALPALSV